MSAAGSGNTVIVATKNAGKVREFAHAFAPLGLSVHSMFDYDHLPEIVEDGDTFRANARKKAESVGRALGLPVLADDSGLEVALLDGAPGVYSARYAGEGASDRANNEKLLSELERIRKERPEAAGELYNRDVAGRLPDGAEVLSRARFVCALAFYNPISRTFTESEGFAEGWIINRPFGEEGFGYDPLFWVPSYNRTMGELSKDEKQSISHRGQALKRLIDELGGLRTD
ncbi:non-canonical purine NTP pyrophosphatase [Paenibacillus tarimensis]|uniref:non-canonical purine NTP pyrophosphatase n=1 Tax=Paenibacillus tarimensis TaxID=416012 RepID=UPI001F3F9839|nr:non-canonical purine NTP pyrophosphatase [Paenibacillus tarimensis]MCF2943915.1 non-canonical purine NTP pyrophosphatase [Paenibacillus tarimensis]